MTTETPAPPQPNPCPQWCEVWDGGTAADLSGPPLSPELAQEIHESVAQAQPADLDSMLGTTDPTPVIVGVLVVLAVVLVAATVLVKRHRAAATEGDVPL